MKRFEKCKDCRNKMNDDYCLYCYHHYHIHKLSRSDICGLSDYYMKDPKEIKIPEDKWS